MALSFKRVRRLFQVPAHGRVRLRDYDPGWAAEKHFKDLTKDELKAFSPAIIQSATVNGKLLLIPRRVRRQPHWSGRRLGRGS